LKEYGDVYSLTAIKPDTRLFLGHHEGKRTADDCIEFFNDIEERRAIDSPIPVFTSDNWDPFEEGLIGGHNAKKEDQSRGTYRTH
jgi:HEAT repeat protein